LGYAVLTLLIVATVTFFLMRSIPGDPLSHMTRGLPEQTRENYYAKYGLDQPLFTQYLMYMKNLLQGDFGESVVFPGRSVTDTIKNTSPVSGIIGGSALIIGLIIGVTLGIIAALNKNRWPDYLVMFIAILGVTIPIFVIASLAQYLAAVKLDILPPSGWGRPEHLILPIFVMCFGPIASFARYMKSSMLETMSQDYILTAQAKGLSRRMVILKHALRNSLIPIATILAARIVAIFTGSFIVERMFGIPGIGFYYISSINNNDYSMILGTTIFYAALFILAQLAVDFMYMVIDPRIRVTAESR
jgi:oligopeptide transport system permease protein